MERINPDEKRTALAELRAALQEWELHRCCSNKQYGALFPLIEKHWPHMGWPTAMLAMARELDRVEAERDGLDKDYGGLAREHDATLADLADLRGDYLELVEVPHGGNCSCRQCAVLAAARRRVSEWRP